MDVLVAKFGYFGIFLVLVLGGLGLPVPEEAPLILAAVLARKGAMNLPLAFTTCLTGVLVGDFVVYFLGFFYGEKVLSLPLTRKFLTKERETQIQGYFHRHGIKILILGRFAVGFRTAAYLTAGILKLPTLKLFLTDLCAATFSTVLMFGLGYIFARQIEDGIKEAQHWVTVGLAVGLATWLLIRFYKARKRRGRLVGPPVLVEIAEIPAPHDDLTSLAEPTEPRLDPAPVSPIAAIEESPAEILEALGLLDRLAEISSESETERPADESAMVHSAGPRRQDPTSD